MWSRRRILVSLLLGLLGLTVLFGCRAFEPEAVIVNKTPDTFITGAPAETTGGYFHFHVFWYGTDDDGRVDRFVWALTDTSVQDRTVDGDEEDTRFNPATNVNTLRIANWTTRTDTVFDFRIRQGSNLAYDMTLHMVAIDDQGAYDRTPARLHFISNALGNPVIAFYRSDTAGTGPLFAENDTVAYGHPFALSWAGISPNVRSYSPEMLAARDTVPPLDGLFGYKFRLLDAPCEDASADCWQPRHFDPVTGDSVSYFGDQTQLRFTNDDSGVDVRFQRLGSGIHSLLVNTTDMAGVEVPQSKQGLNFIVNYDPDTRLLRGETDPFNPSDGKVYPYYRVFHPDGTVTEHTFAEGDTVPDKAYVVFKGLGWDDARDLRVNPALPATRFQAAFDAIGLYGGETRFPFSTQFSELHVTSEWIQPEGSAADTVGFLVGPFEYTFTMRAVDEHGRRDGTPETFRFVGDFRPCVQCVEVLTGTDSPAADGDLPCQAAACAGVDTIYAALAPSTAVGPTWKAATLIGPGLLWYNARTGAVWLDTPASTVEPDSMPGYFYEYRLALHGKEVPLEPWNPARPQDRIMSWNYQVNSVPRDTTNVVAEGGGTDDLSFTTFRWEPYNPLAVPSQPIYIDDEGVWTLRIKFFVPQLAMQAGEAIYIGYLQARYADWRTVYNLTTKQLGLTVARVRANDASNCTWNPDRSKYFFYRTLRVPTFHGMSCTGVYPDVLGSIRLSDFMRTTPGELDGDNAAYRKQYVIKAVPFNGVVFPTN